MKTTDSLETVPNPITEFDIPVLTAKHLASNRWLSNDILIAFANAINNQVKDTFVIFYNSTIIEKSLISDKVEEFQRKQSLGTISKWIILLRVGKIPTNEFRGGSTVFHDYVNPVDDSMYQSGHYSFVVCNIEEEKKQCRYCDSNGWNIPLNFESKMQTLLSQLYPREEFSGLTCTSCHSNKFIMGD